MFFMRIICLFIPPPYTIPLPVKGRGMFRFGDMASDVSFILPSLSGRSGYKAPWWVYLSGDALEGRRCL